MTEVTAYLPIFEQGHKVAELTVTVRANYDQTFADDLAADVFFDDEDGKRHGFIDARAVEILAEIKKHQPEVWREIKEMAEANHLEGCAYDASGSTYFSHEAA
jgi:hypothetical protein